LITVTASSCATPTHLRSEEEMNVMASHYPVKGGGVGHTLGRHLVGDARNDQIDGLERAVRLLCQYQAKIFELVLLVELFAFSEVQNDTGIGAEEHHDQQYRAGIKKPQRRVARGRCAIRQNWSTFLRAMGRFCTAPATRC
jgi:hypothetical protein